MKAFIFFMKLFTIFMLTMGAKCAFLTALKSSKSLSSLSVPKAAIRCWWCIFAKSHGPKNMETNGEIDRRGQIDRWRDEGRKMRDERGKTSALAAHPAPLPDLFFPPQRNKSRNRLKAAVPDLVAFHPRSSGSVPVPALAAGKKSQVGVGGTTDRKWRGQKCLLACFWWALPS